MAVRVSTWVVGGDGSELMQSRARSHCHAVNTRSDAENDMCRMECEPERWGTLNLLSRSLG